MFATARPRRTIVQYEELLHPDSVVTLNGARTFINNSSIDYSIPYESVRTMLKGFLQIPESCGSVFKILISNANTNLNGVKAMLDAFGIEPEEAVYFGDDNDDIELLKWCENGIAVKNAISEALSAANEVTASNDEDGVALWIEKFVV